MNHSFFYKSLLTFLLMAVAFGSLNAQIIAPFYPEIPASVLDQVQVSNTGNSVVMYDGNPLKVSVWDGHTASFSFDYNNGAITGEKPLQGTGTSAGGMPYDPDVVIGPVSDGRFIIVYYWHERVWMETWKFDGTDCLPDLPPAVISSGSLPCFSPNIDQSNEIGAIVWEQGGRIKGRTINMFTFALTPEVEFGACLPGEKKMPDVSVYNDGLDVIANVVFTHRDATNDLVFHRTDMLPFASGISPACTSPDFKILKSVPLGPPTGFHLPRIASTPAVTTPHDYRDLQIVVTEWLPGYTTQITGFNLHAATWGVDNFHESAISVSPSADLTQCGNFGPVVTYTACEGIMVEWWYRTLYYTPCVTEVDWQYVIIGKQLDHSSTPWYDDFSRLSWDMDFFVRYSAPSVSGKYLATESPVGSIFSTFSRSNDHKMFYKTSSCGIVTMKNQNLEPEEMTVDDVYPNPFQNRLTIGLVDPEIRSIEVLNLNGQTLQKWGRNETITLDSKSLTWDATSLPDGVYFIRIDNGTSVHVKKVVKMN